MDLWQPTARGIRADFAKRLVRRLEGMSQDRHGCACKPKRLKDHEPPCAGYYWERSAWITKDLLDEMEEE